MYKVSWKRNDSWLAIIVDNKADMLMEVADKVSVSDQVKVRMVGD